MDTRVDAIRIARIQGSDLLIPPLCSDDEVIVDRNGDVATGVLETLGVVRPHRLSRHNNLLERNQARTDGMARRIVVVDAQNDFDQFEMRTLRDHTLKKALDKFGRPRVGSSNEIRFFSTCIVATRTLVLSLCFLEQIANSVQPIGARTSCIFRF